MEIEKILEKYFSEYKEYHQYALISIIVIIALFQIWQTIFVSRKIEKFKNELKRSEIRYSRFNNMQIDALKSIYDQIVTFHYKNHQLFFHPKAFGHSVMKTRMNDWSTEVVKLIDSLHRERILLSDEIFEKAQKFESNFRKISRIIEAEFNNIIAVEELHGTDDVQMIYKTPEEELSSIALILNHLKDNELINDSDNLVRELRFAIENYFSDLTK